MTRFELILNFKRDTLSVRHETRIMKHVSVLIKIINI